MDPAAPEDVYSPYGFGGFFSTFAPGQAPALQRQWVDFFQRQGICTAYIMQHPAAEFAQGLWGEETVLSPLCVYVTDLSLEEDALWSSLDKIHRYEIRRLARETKVQSASDTPAVLDALLKHYPNTMQAVGAAAVYHFSAETLRRFASLPGALLLGAEVQGQVEAVALFLRSGANGQGSWGEYFLSASSPAGRHATRLLIWEGILRLRTDGARWLNLGGGAAVNDGLDAFQRRFGGQAVFPHVLKQILIPEQYAAVCQKYHVDPDPSGYFPPYWRQRNRATSPSSTD
ncbi:MAG: GNAT family N-acetyltransferase [Desulfovibrio sp.]|nr:GNAT family N-acetyltransferase [Desulfovibrio sp.]